MKFLHSIAVADQLVAADGVLSFDLPVNALSMLLINIKPLNDTGTLANMQRYLGLCDSIERIVIQKQGASIKNLSGQDLAAINMFRHNILPREANPDDTDDERRHVILPVLFGRFPYDPKSCLPASRRGELVMDLQFDIADTGYDGLRISVDTVEILDAHPTEYERATTIARTFAATGFNDIELPLGNRVRGLGLFGTTDFTGASPAPTLGTMQVRLDNQEVGYSGIDFETAVGLTGVLGGRFPYVDSHTHRVTTDGNAQVALETSGGPIEQGSTWLTRCYLDLDPTRDDTFSVDTKGAQSFQLRVNADAANAMRVVCIERVGV